MSKWFNRFWADHGDRLVFMGIATVFGLGIAYLGYKLKDEKLMGTGIGMIVVVGGLALNKARSTNGTESKPPIPNPII